MEIIFNNEFMRWEVYSEKSVIRNKEKQPVFVSPLKIECEIYCQRVKK